ncbi:hypothetical protein RUM43_004388 [Polyplax serrata]|uniref:Ig-like domain-containing protein n=1 Tax=Polyplax serrata TaxID=468196 RepID=A0AAN8SC84_POLSC
MYLKRRESTGNYEQIDFGSWCATVKNPEARARIKGPTDLYVKTGSSVAVTCIISQGPHDLGTVFWYKDKTIIQVSHPHPNEYDPFPRVMIETEWTDGLTSVLRISHAQLVDSGNYTCTPTIAEAASVNVHVISGRYLLQKLKGIMKGRKEKKNSSAMLQLEEILILSFYRESSARRLPQRAEESVERNDIFYFPLILWMNLILQKLIQSLEPLIFLANLSKIPEP